MERALNKKRGFLTDFAYGLIIGFITAVIICSIITSLVYINHKSREALQYVEKQIELEMLREDYSGRNTDEFLEIPDIRRAADGAADEFIRMRDEILFEFRNRLAD